jgi:hypothetical protein
MLILFDVPTEQVLVHGWYCHIKITWSKNLQILRVRIDMYYVSWPTKDMFPFGWCDHNIPLYFFQLHMLIVISELYQSNIDK